MKFCNFVLYFFPTITYSDERHKLSTSDELTGERNEKLQNEFLIQ